MQRHHHLANKYPNCIRPPIAYRLHVTGLSSVIDMSKPTPIAALCFGANADPWVFAELDNGSPDWAQHSWDLKLALSDPLGSGRVKFHENGCVAKTVVAVAGQPKFEPTAQHLGPLLPVREQ